MSQTPAALIPPKPFKSHSDLIALLQSRGMVIDDPVRAERKLAQVGYYRLSGFWYQCRMIDFDLSGNAKRCPLTNLPIRLNQFIPGTTFSAIFDLYLFDKKLRQAMLDAVERVEVHLRTLIAHELGYHDPMAYLDAQFIHPRLTQNYTRRGSQRNTWREWQDRNQRKIDECREDSIQWHKKRNMALPFWVITEAWDFGTMSKYFEIMLGKHQNRIAAKVGCSNPKEMVGWLKELNTLRNRCAHHTRVWNQKASNTLAVSSVPRLSALGLDAHALSRIFGQVAILWHLVTQIGPRSGWLDHVAQIIDSKPVSPNCTFSAMGFPDELGFPRHLFP